MRYGFLFHSLAAAANEDERLSYQREAPHLWYFGSWKLLEDPYHVDMVVIARQFPLVPVHSTNSGLTPALVTEIRAGQDGGFRN